MSEPGKESVRTSITQVDDEISFRTREFDKDGDMMIGPHSGPNILRQSQEGVLVPVVERVGIPSQIFNSLWRCRGNWLI